ncbi:MAG TPA: CdaR family protein, partial [Chloroflexota bacterium]|nr:CdaR family protein [Chloroflexota bacterium]
MRFPFYVDVGRAVFAVALAVLLYFVALSETNPAASADLGTPVPVQPVNVPSGLVITTPPPPVRLRVTAPQNVFGRLRPDSFTAQVDVSSAHAGDNDLPITVNTT